MRPINPTVLDMIRSHARSVVPAECCGAVVSFRGTQSYIPFTNVSSSPMETFMIDPAQFSSAEDVGEIEYIVHSHVNTPSTPSETDRVECMKSGYSWLIYSTPSNEFTVLHPDSEYRAPLIGREFSRGIHDCYGLARDYYRETLGIELENVDRRQPWWEVGHDLIGENLGKLGFITVAENMIRLHDGIIMQIGSSVPNHVGVYVGNNLILHHLMNRLSSRDVYGGYLRTVTVKIVRHETLI